MIFKNIIRLFCNKKSLLFTNQKNEYRCYSIGDYTYGEPRIIKGRTHGCLYIGKYCSIAEEVELLLVNDHRTNWVSTYPFPVTEHKVDEFPAYPRRRGDIIIKNDVWIGRGAKIVAGATVGNGAVVGAHCLVTKDVPDYAIVVGNPQKIIKYRFNEDVVTKLLSIAWWNWDHSRVQENLHLICSDRVADFCNAFYS